MDESKYVTVADLNKQIKGRLDSDPTLQQVFLKGEISNFKAHTRGHYYFSLKDETSKINAIMFGFNTKKVVFTPANGMKVLIQGKISVYEATGAYQIYVEDMIEDGVGNLHIAFEQLKKKLQDEGLFDKEHKKKIPKIPKKIGIITAPTGAAIRDVISTIKRRFPIADTILFPALVQGDNAKTSIVKQIKEAQKWDIDVLIVGRGGGSIEDLWGFNEEVVARAIYDCPIPIISAVGHEIDFTISDFVADVRAATPTGAAEIAVPSLIDINNYIKQVQIRLNESLDKKISNNRLKLEKLSHSFVLTNPISIYEAKEQKLDMFINRSEEAINNKLNVNQLRLEKLSSAYVLTNPKYIYESKKEKTNTLIKQLEVSIKNIKKENSNKLDNIIGNLEILNPLNSLKRGYTITKKDNKAISTIKNIEKNDNLNIQLKDGNVDVVVTEKRKS